MNANGDDSNRKEGALRRPSRVWRTLLGAAIGAVLAMLFVPRVSYLSPDYYRLIFDASGKIDVPQLVLNVVFAALVGALAANLSRRAALWTARSMAGVALVLAAWLGFSAYQMHMKMGAEREEGTAYGAILNGNLYGAKEHLLKASNYWWWKGWWYGARKARERAFDEQRMKKESAVFFARQDEERAAELLLGRWWNNDWHPRKDQDVKTAKQLLLDAAERWHVAGNTAEEQRVRAKEENIIDLSGLPDQSPTPAPAKNVYDQFDTAKAYQVTGPVLEVTDTMIAVQKGQNRWEVARDSNTKVMGDLKVGATVTIKYTMTAAEVAVKPSKDIFDRLSPSDFPDQPQKPR